MTRLHHRRQRRDDIPIGKWSLLALVVIGAGVIGFFAGREHKQQEIERKVVEAVQQSNAVFDEIGREMQDLQADAQAEADAAMKQYRRTLREIKAIELE